MLATTRWWLNPLVIAGVSIWLLCLAGWAVAWAFAPRVAAAMGASFAAFLLGGKLAGVPTGLQLDLHPLLVAGVVTLPDAGAVLFTYPAVAKGWEKAGKWSLVLAGVKERAMENETKESGIVGRFGSWGILLLTLTPVGFVSPIIVAAIGQLMGLAPARRVLVPVFAGMAVMGLTLAFLFSAGLDLAARVHPALPFVLTGTLVLALVSREAYLRFKARKKKT